MRREYSAPKNITKPQDQKDKKTDRKDLIISIIIASIFLSGAVYFGYKAYDEHHQHVVASEGWENVRKIDNVTIIDDPELYHIDTNAVSDSETSSDVEEKVETDNNMLVKHDLQALTNKNSDVMCWITIPNTKMDYPVMQEKKYGQYAYLHADMNKQWSIAGSIFSAACPDETKADTDGEGVKDFARIIIYGHNMNDGSMFADLKKYSEKDFYNKHKYIYLYYPDRTERWLIVSTAHVNPYAALYDMRLRLESDEYKDVIKKFPELNYYKINEREISPSEKTLTLSTCDNTGAARIAVTGVLDRTLVFD